MADSSSTRRAVVVNLAEYRRRARRSVDMGGRRLVVAHVLTPRDRAHRRRMLEHLASTVRAVEG
ncbi:MAG: hypothetical protein DIU54_003365 [Acidobacteriota bacterium]|jgi:hypothetical protein